VPLYGRELLLVSLVLHAHVSLGPALSIFALPIRLQGDHTLDEEEAMQYMLLIHTGGDSDEFEKLSQDEQNAIFGEYMAVGQSPGVVGGNQLQPASTATTVRVEDGRTLTTDGPFAETKEELGGYFVFEADDLDAAIELASRIPAARMGGAVEVRPIVERQS
jgi:hypothetical protein